MGSKTHEITRCEGCKREAPLESCTCGCGKGLCWSCHAAHRPKDDKRQAEMAQCLGEIRQRVDGVHHATVAALVKDEYVRGREDVWPHIASATGDINYLLHVVDHLNARIAREAAWVDRLVRRIELLWKRGGCELSTLDIISVIQESLANQPKEPDVDWGTPIEGPVHIPIIGRMDEGGQVHLNKNADV